MGKKTQDYKAQATKLINRFNRKERSFFKLEELRALMLDPKNITPNNYKEAKRRLTDMKKTYEVLKAKFQKEGKLSNIKRVDHVISSIAELDEILTKLNQVSKAFTAGVEARVFKNSEGQQCVFVPVPSMTKPSGSSKKVKTEGVLYIKNRKGTYEPQKFVSARQRIDGKSIKK
jgi:hypothetical protein